MYKYRKRKEVTQQFLDSGQRPPRPQSVLRKEDLERMADTLVQHCDSLERYGLVDYQMGIWEEEIMSSKPQLRKPQIVSFC